MYVTDTKAVHVFSVSVCVCVNSVFLTQSSAGTLQTTQSDSCMNVMYLSWIW